MHSLVTEEALDTALSNQQIVAYFQPQINLITRKVVGTEALSRWIHPEFGVVRPDVFIPKAEELGKIHALGSEMLKDACRFAAAHVAHGRFLETSVNVSPVELATRDFPERALAAVREFGVPPTLLTFEITERQLVDSMDETIHIVEDLVAVGFQVSIDDLGANAESIGRVLKLPATEIKIDRSIVADPEAHDLILDFVSLGQDHGMRVVAEGVETTEQMDRMADAGCHRAQGYYISRPLSAFDFGRWLESSPFSNISSS